MKLYALATGDCSDKQKQVYNRLFVKYGDAVEFAEDKFDVDYTVFDMWVEGAELKDFNFIDLKLASKPLSSLDKQCLLNTLSYSIQELESLKESIDWDNPRENIFKAKVHLKNRLKTLESFLESDNYKAKTNLFDFEVVENANK